MPMKKNSIKAAKGGRSKRAGANYGSKGSRGRTGRRGRTLTGRRVIINGQPHIIYF